MKNTISIVLSAMLLSPLSMSWAAENCNGPNQELRSNGHGGSYCHTNIDIDEIYAESGVAAKNQKPSSDQMAQPKAMNQNTQTEVEQDKQVCPNCTFKFQRVDNDLDVDAMIDKWKKMGDEP